MCMELTVGKYILPLEVMDTPTKRMVGMMGRKKLNGGMLFILPNIQEHSFWMKNCLIPLDIIMLVDNKVTTIHKNCTPCMNNCERYTGLGNMVLELKGGMCDKLKIIEGDELNIS